MTTSKIQQLDNLETFTNRVVSGRSRQEALIGLASVFQSFTQGFSVALSNYIWKRTYPRINDADVMTRLADSIIDRFDLPPLDAPRNFAMLTLLCQKCSGWFEEEKFADHWNTCPWTCGLCGNLIFGTHAYFQKHVSTCKAPIQQGWTNYGNAGQANYKGRP